MRLMRAFNVDCLEENRNLEVFAIYRRERRAVPWKKSMSNWQCLEQSCGTTRVNPSNMQDQDGIINIHLDHSIGILPQPLLCTNNAFVIMVKYTLIQVQ